jgi:hypothetical protein
MLIISNNVWNEIAHIIPGKQSKVGRPLSDSRRVLSGVFYIMLTGAQWRQLLDYYGKPLSTPGVINSRESLDQADDGGLNKFSEFNNGIAESNSVGQNPKTPSLPSANSPRRYTTLGLLGFSDKL